MELNCKTLLSTWHCQVGSTKHWPLAIAIVAAIIIDDHNCKAPSRLSEQADKSGETKAYLRSDRLSAASF